jgi:hypothetical protein
MWTGSIWFRLVVYFSEHGEFLDSLKFLKKDAAL